MLFVDGPLANATLSNCKTAVITPTKSVSEPVSGFKTAIANIYSNVLESFISVLSSVSSHILHSIFYEVIGEFLL